MSSMPTWQPADRLSGIPALPAAPSSHNYMARVCLLDIHGSASLVP